jgi:hypothetical protein
MDFHFDPVTSLFLICLLYGNENRFFDTMKFASYLVVAILLMTWVSSNERYWLDVIFLALPYTKVFLGLIII